MVGSHMIVHQVMTGGWDVLVVTFDFAHIARLLRLSYLTFYCLNLGDLQLERLFNARGPFLRSSMKPKRTRYVDFRRKHSRPKLRELA